MEQDIQELLIKIKGEIVKLRNDVLLTQHTVNQIEKKLEKLETKSLSPEPNLDQVYGKNTRIEKF